MELFLRGEVSQLKGRDVEKNLDALFLKIENGDDESSIRVITAAQDLNEGDQLLASYGEIAYQVSVIDINSKTDGYVEYICDWSDYEETEVVTQKASSEEAKITESDFESIWEII